MGDSDHRETLNQLFSPNILMLNEVHIHSRKYQKYHMQKKLVSLQNVLSDLS